MTEELSKNTANIQEKTVTVSDGVVLTVYDFQPESFKNDDPVLVFVAGWVSLLKGWQEVLKVISPRFRILYLETREKKSASLPEEKYPEFTVNRMAQDVHEVVKELIPENHSFYFAGSSLGSTVILHYLSNKSYRNPKTAVLISPIGDIHFPFWAKIIINCFPPAAYSVIKHLIIWYLTHFRVDRKKEPEQAEKYKGTVSSAEPKRLQANARSLYDYRVWERLSDIDAPVVLVGAKTDKLHGLESLERMLSLIPDARLEVMGGNKETHSDKAGTLILDIMEQLEESGQ